MSSAKLKIKEALKSKVELRRKTVGPELSISGRKSKDRSAHVIGQENFKSAGEYYAFHDNILKTVSKNSKRKSSKRQSISQPLKVKSEIESVAEAEIVPIKEETAAPSSPCDLKPAIAAPEAPVPLQDVDPQLEIKPVDESSDHDDFIPISPSILSIDEHLSQLIAIQTCLAALVRRRRSIKRSKAAQLAAIARKKKNNDKALREKEKEKEKSPAVPAAKSIEIQETKPSVHQSTDPSIIMSINYEEHINATDFNEDDFEFPTEDDFMAYNGSPNDPMPFSDAVDFTSSSAAGDQIRQISDPNREILAQDEFSCAPSFSCIQKTDTVLDELSLDAILAIKPDEEWKTFNDGDAFEAMNSTVMDMHGDANMEDVDGWLNLTTNEVLPEELVD